MNQHRKGLSLFQLIDRKKFDALAKKHGIDRSVRSFKTWEFTQALICSFVMRLESFREIESALGIPDSTFGDALRLRHSEFFRELCDLVLLEIRGKSESRKCRKAIRQILAIDSSEIDVHGSLFDEPGWKKKYTIGHKASAKLHVVWNVDGQWVEDFLRLAAKATRRLASFFVFPLGHHIFSIGRTMILISGGRLSRRSLTSSLDLKTAQATGGFKNLRCGEIRMRPESFTTDLCIDIFVRTKIGYAVAPHYL